MKKPDLIIFDLDGTLLNTLTSLASAYNNALTRLGCPTHSVAAFRTIIGNGARVAAERCMPADRQSEADILACHSLFEGNYEKLWQTASPYAGIVDVLATLKNTSKLAVLSNKDDVFTQRCVSHFFPDIFDQVLGHKPGVPHKPDPEGCKNIIEAMGASTETTWLVGDTSTDMATARASKVQGIGVLWGYRDKDELTASGAAKIVSAPMELLELLELLER